MDLALLVALATWNGALTQMIEIDQIYKNFPSRDGSPSVIALDHISLQQRKGEFLAVMGPSGCGKTTLLNIIAGFESANSGTCKVDDQLVQMTGPDRGVVFQEYALFPWMTVEENVTFAMRAAGKWASGSAVIAREILGRMGLSNFCNAYPKNLSGGMRQRVAIARILAIDSPVMLMDEPFGALDALTRSVLQEELMILWRETNKTIFFITHSADEAIYLADRVLVMTPRPGKIVLEIDIKLDRPRDLTSPEFNGYKKAILNVVNPSLKSL